MFWPINGKKLKNSLLMILAALIAALIFLTQGQQTEVFMPIETDSALSKVVSNQKQLALTFDMNQGSRQLPLLLNTLKKEHIRATFFISGSWVKGHSALARRIARDGHEIESCGMNNEEYTGMDPQRIRTDMLLGREAIYKATGRRPNMIRPPFGKISKEVLTTAAALKQQTVLWSVNPEDQPSPDYKEIVQSVLERSGSGDIIRLQASDSAKDTERALPLIIREFENRGYHFTTLETLIADARSKSKLLD